MTLYNWRNLFLRYELHVLLLVSLGGMASQSVLVVAVGLICFFSTLRYFDNQQKWWLVVTPVDIAIIGLSLLLPMTWWISIDRATTDTQILRLLNGIGLFYAAVYWLSSKPSVTKLLQIIFAFEGMGLLVVVMGVVSTKWPVNKSNIFDHIYHYLTPISTGNVHPNVLGGTILLFLPIPLTACLFPLLVKYRQSQPLSRIYGQGWILGHGLVSFCLFCALILTQSRGAGMGLIAMLGLLVLCLGGKRCRLLLFGGIAVVGIFGMCFPQQFTTLFSRLTSDSAISTSALRFEVWSRAYYMLQDFPFTGIGMGNFRQVLETMYPLFLTTEVIPHAHNLFLQIGVDLGVIGLICWLAIVLGVTASIYSVIRQTETNLDKPEAFIQYMLAIAFLGSQTALLIHGLVDAVTWSGVRTAPFVWLLWGIAVGMLSSMDAEIT